MPEITSRHHPVVRAFKDAARGARDVALLDGWHLLHDAVAAGVEITTVAVAGPPPSRADADLLELLSSSADVLSVSRAVLDALSPSQTPSGVAALAVPRTWTASSVHTPSPALVVVGCDIQDPGNGGAVVRSAEAGGATGVVLAGASVDPWGWKTLRASMGSVFRLPVVRNSDAMEACRQLRDAGVRLIASVPRGGESPERVPLTGDVALLLGGEGAGLTPSLVDVADERLSIPMSGAVESLNVAVAAALVVYEARRQRR